MKRIKRHLKAMETLARVDDTPAWGIRSAPVTGRVLVSSAREDFGPDRFRTLDANAILGRIVALAGCVRFRSPGL